MGVRLEKGGPRVQFFVAELSLLVFIMVLSCGGVFLFQRWNQTEPPLIDGLELSNWIELAQSPDELLREESVASLERALASIRDPKPMNCAGGIVFVPRGKSLLQAEVRKHLEGIADILEQGAQSANSRVQVSSMKAIANLALWDHGAHTRRLLPALIKAATKGNDLETQRAARESIILNLTFGCRGFADYVGMPIQDLIPILTSPDLDPNLRYYAVVILGYIGPDAREALSYLDKIIKDVALAPDGTGVVQQAAWAKRRINGQE